MNKFLLSFLIVLTFFIEVQADILSIHKKIVPISLLQIKSIVQNSKKSIHLVIVAKRNQMAKALQFKSMLPLSIKSFSFKTVVIDEKDIKFYALKNQGYIDAFYCFELTDKSYDFLNDFAKTNNLPTFSYNKDGLNNGMLLYIDFTNTIKIYMNKDVLKDNNILFNSRFLLMVKSYVK